MDLANPDAACLFEMDPFHPASDHTSRDQAWTDLAASEHIVQFYEADTTLVNSLAAYVSSGLDAGDRCIVIATQPHRDALDERLAAYGIDTVAAHDLGDYLVLDAAETLALFMRGGCPDPDLFYATVGHLVESAPGDKRRLRAFGEMVGLLWNDGSHAAAIRLEELWNELAEAYTFSLLCGYQMGGFHCNSHIVPFDHICKSHTRVIPAESYTALPESNAQEREIASLQQRALALEAEVARRTEAERALEARLAEIEELNARLKRSVTETHHRVKNNLQLMSALIELRRGSDRDVVPMSELVKLGQNIQALGVIHDLLTIQTKRDGDAETVSARGVIERLLEVLQTALSGLNVRSTLDDVALPGKHATALALIANELISNAVKHGNGGVWITLRADGGRVCLEVRDDGPGFPEEFDPDTCANTGLDLVENIARVDLRGTTHYGNHECGGCVSVTFAASESPLASSGSRSA